MLAHILFTQHASHNFRCPSARAMSPSDMAVLVRSVHQLTAALLWSVSPQCGPVVAVMRLSFPARRRFSAGAVRVSATQRAGTQVTTSTARHATT